MASPFCCPVHRDERLVVLYYHEMKINGKGKKTGTAKKSKFLYCRVCELPMRITVDAILQRVKA